MLDRDAAAAGGAVARIGGNAAACAPDVADEAPIDRVFAEIDSLAGAFNILVNNAEPLSAARPSSKTLDE